MAARGGRERERDRDRDRDRIRKDFPSRFDDKSAGNSGHTGSKAPPSRHLWVGNLAHHIIEKELTHHFVQFGPLESVAFQPGRSYAFINFVRDDDAIDAMKELQGFPVAGNPLRIEFAKADKPSSISRKDDYSQSRDERSRSIRGSPLPHRDFRGYHESPEPPFYDKSKISGKDPEPSEVLWIGFPTSLKVDEISLRKAFSQFGEIEKITTFPGRSYAFVRFRNLMSAFRAKESLHGKLFGNPRVNICFAKSESGSHSSGRSSDIDHHASLENTRHERNFRPLMEPGSPQLLPPWTSDDADVYNFNRKEHLSSGGVNSHEQVRFGEKGSDVRLRQDLYEFRGTPTRERHALPHDISPRFPKKGPMFEDPWDLPEEIQYFHEAKKLKTEYLPDKELPEYPFSELERQKHVFSRASTDISLHDKAFKDGRFSLEQMPERMSNFAHTVAERSDHWKQSYDSVQLDSGPSGSLQSNSIAERRRFTPEPDKPSLTEWKWVGTIAKGGTPVCRARCFPVGKILDIFLPEFIDCTARTSLDMLSKHYYQASGAWVVFFVPESDADISFYNEFLHYLEEKQRAAVAKLDDKNTLFLVPPSDFSQKVLKVPGKLSISGVVLRLEQYAVSGGAPIPNQNDPRDINLGFDGVALHKSSIPPVYNLPSTSSLPFSRGMITSPTALPHDGVGRQFEPNDDRRHKYPINQRNLISGSNWSSQHLQQSGTLPHDTNPVVEEQQQFTRRPVQDLSHSQYTPGPSSTQSVGGLHQEQLAQMASSLFELQRQAGSQANGSKTQFRHPQTSVGQQNTSEVLTSQFPQVLQRAQQQSGNLAQLPQMVDGNEQLLNSAQESEGDPQKRLQATLQLAAALLQQIQHGK